MTKEELNTRVEKSLERAELILSDTGGLPSILEIHFTDDNGKKNMQGIVLVGSTPEDGHKTIRGLGLIFGAMKRLNKVQELHCVVMMSETWFSTFKKDEYKLPHKSPSEDPNLREMLSVCGQTLDGIILMKGKEMFSVEVKGKRHFTLKDFPIDEPDKHGQSNILDAFFKGYNIALEPSEKNKMLDGMVENIKDMPLQELLPRAFKVLADHVGGHVEQVK